MGCAAAAWRSSASCYARQFVAQGFMSGTGLHRRWRRAGNALANPADRRAALSPGPRLAAAGPLPDQSTAGAGKIPFICFDLAGGANIAGSNVLIGQEGGQQDFLNTNGYERQGLPGDMIPGLTDPVSVLNLPYANFDLGLGFHLDSAFRRGIMQSLTPGTASSSSTAPSCRLARTTTRATTRTTRCTASRARAPRAQILTLCGSENTDSGGNSMLPAMLYDRRAAAYEGRQAVGRREPRRHG